MNFAFLVMKTMRFYGWSWPETMKTPVSAFWTCYQYIDRLRAQETLDRLPEQSIAMAKEEDQKAFIAALEQQIGTVVVDKPVFDREGWRKLREISHK